MSKGRRERNIRFAMWIVFWSLLFWGIYSFLAWTDRRDMKLMEVDFCKPSVVIGRGPHTQFIPASCYNQ